MAEACARLEVDRPDGAGGRGVIYVRSRWFPLHFRISISDGLDAWICQVSEEEVSRKAFSWDYTVAQYLEEAKEHLDHQKPNCTYSFTSVGDGGRKLAWTLEKDGVQLVANCKLERSPDPRETTCEILDCLMTGTSRLSEELQRKTRSFERMKAEAQSLTAQSKKFRDQKVQFEADIYRKFVAVLNSKKAKLRELREIALHTPSSVNTKRKEEAEEETESEDELDDSDDETDHLRKEKPLESQHNQYGRKEDDAEGSEATDILAPESPTTDVSSYHRDPHKDISTNNSKKLETVPGVEHLTASTSIVSSQKRPVEAIVDAATLLSGPSYTSAPRRRRHL